MFLIVAPSNEQARERRHISLVFVYRLDVPCLCQYLLRTNRQLNTFCCTASAINTNSSQWCSEITGYLLQAILVWLRLQDGSGKSRQACSQKSDPNTETVKKKYKKMLILINNTERWKTFGVSLLFKATKRQLIGDKWKYYTYLVTVCSITVPCQPEKYIFIYHRLTVVLSLLKKGAYLEKLHTFCIVLKMSVLFNSLFGSCFRTLSVSASITQHSSTKST